ncbi:hypothetical protein [Desulfarculus baarsii]
MRIEAKVTICDGAGQHPPGTVLDLPDGEALALAGRDLAAIVDETRPEAPASTGPMEAMVLGHGQPAPAGFFLLGPVGDKALWLAEGGKGLGFLRKTTCRQVLADLGLASDGPVAELRERIAQALEAGA